MCSHLTKLHGKHLKFLNIFKSIKIKMPQMNVIYNSDFLCYFSGSRSHGYKTFTMPESSYLDSNLIPIRMSNSYAPDVIDSDVMPGTGHYLVSGRSSTNRACAFCKMKDIRTHTGLPTKSYWMCNGCNVFLCRPKVRPCFRDYHKMLIKMGVSEQGGCG